MRAFNHGDINRCLIVPLNAQINGLTGRGCKVIHRLSSQPDKRFVAQRLSTELDDSATWTIASITVPADEPAAFQSTNETQCGTGGKVGCPSAVHEVDPTLVTNDSKQVEGSLDRSR